MKFTIIKKIVLISTLFASLMVKEAYSITAAQAARQQQISAEIEKVLTKKVDESNYTDWTEEVNDLINKYKGVNVPDVQMKIKSLQTIAQIQNKPESIEKKVKDTDELRKNQPTTPNLNPPSKTLTKEETKRLVSINNLIDPGTHILNDISKKTNAIPASTIEFWKKSAIEEVTVQSLNPQIKAKIDELKNILDMIKAQQGQQGPTGQISQNEQTIIEKINSLVNINDLTHNNFDAWITDAEKIFHTHEKSTSNAIQDSLNKLGIRIINTENGIYEYIKRESNKNFIAMLPQDYDQWKDDIERGLSNFYKIKDVIGKFNIKPAPDYQKILPDLTQIEEKITNEDNRRANVKPGGTLSLNTQESEILQKLDNLHTEINKGPKLDKLVSMKNDFTVTIKEATDLLSRTAQTREAHNLLTNNLRETKKSFFDESLNAIAHVLANEPFNKKLETLSNYIPKSNKATSSVQSKIKNDLEEIYTNCGEIRLLLPILVENEALNEKNSTNLYNVVCSTLLGSSDFLKNFKVTTSVYLIDEKIRNWILEAYVKNSLKTETNEVDFVKSVRDTLHELMIELFDIAEGLEHSKIMLKMNSNIMQDINNFKGIITKNDEEFSNKITNIYK